VDDILAINHNAMSVIREIDIFFKMKSGTIGDPDIYYLGSKLRLLTLPNGVWAWSLLASKYVPEAIRNVKDYFKQERPGWTPASMAETSYSTTPFRRDYRPELDMSVELGDEEASFFQSQIGILQWMVEISRVDIITEVSMLASCVMAPMAGHPKQYSTCLHIWKRNTIRVLYYSIPHIPTLT
jgi:hypothetical protein